MYIGAQFGVYELPYHAGERAASAQPRKIAAVRASGTARDHVTTTVAVTKGRLYASVGSSCNNCDPDLDATRATVQEMNLDGSGMTAKARHVRNAIALAVNPQTGTLWIGIAGQDELAKGHPYETFDPLTLRAGVADYGWPCVLGYEKPSSRGRSRLFLANGSAGGLSGIRNADRCGVLSAPSGRRARLSGSLSRRRVRDVARLLAPAAGSAARGVRADERRRSEDGGRLERPVSAMERVHRRLATCRRTPSRTSHRYRRRTRRQHCFVSDDLDGGIYRIRPIHVSP